MEVNVLDGIVVGGAGGAIAGLSVYLIQHLHNCVLNKIEGDRLHKWLSENSTLEKQPFRSTRAIASHNNLTEDRVRFLCSRHKGIFLSTGREEDMWSIHERAKISSTRRGDEFINEPGL
jgi:hypothetical protein